jgi:UDP-N-acetylmuramoylalanine--D-glutamate ligase
MRSEEPMQISFFGYGLTTRAIAKKLGGGCSFYDDNCTESYTDAEGNHIHPSAQFDPDKSQIEILTPSIPPQHPLLQKAKNPVSEYDYFLHNVGRGVLSPTMDTSTHTKPFTIWISGTNGKTTTTQMLTHILEKRGAVYGGNIGVPLAELDPAAAIWVLESSSYTLHHTRHASPDIYLLLPITPDHLDWHGTAEQYEADKLRPLLTMREGELALVPKGLTLPQTDAWVVEYDSNAFVENFFSLDGTKLRYKAAFLQDALLSLAVTRTLFDEADYDLLNGFQLDHHRQEELTDSQGRLWVNDSKATNVDATVQAIHTYSDRKIHLILGGDDKGVDLTPLMDLIATEAITLYTVGSNSDMLISMAATRSIPAHSCHTLIEAVKAIDADLQVDEVALLSPAASSLDQFPSYARRGELFMETVQNLRNS